MELTVRLWGRPTRRVRRGNEAGFTLTEVLVSIAVLALIGGAIAGALAIGIRTLQPGGALARLNGSHDLLIFEQKLGADVARADCLATAGASAPVPTGGCAVFLTKTASCTASGDVLCIGWYVPGSTTCNVVIYSSDSGGNILRSDLSAATEQHVSTGPLKVTASWTTSPVQPSNAYQWTDSSGVVVSVTQVGATGAPVVDPSSATFHAIPRTVDPLSAALPTGAVPC